MEYTDPRWESAVAAAERDLSTQPTNAAANAMREDGLTRADVATNLSIGTGTLAGMLAGGERHMTLRGAVTLCTRGLRRSIRPELNAVGPDAHLDSTAH